MLVLTRKSGQSFELYVDGKHAGSVTVVHTNAVAVRVVFDIPDHVHVVRSELERKDAA